MAAMLEGRNNTFSPLWEIKKSIFMQKSFIVDLPSNMFAVKIL